MKKNILYFLLGAMFIITISTTYKKESKKETKKIISGTLVNYGDGYNLYEHSVNGKLVFVAKSTNSYPVSVAVSED